MNNDESIWQCIGDSGFCSFKVKRKQPPEVFCKNEYNLTGLCRKSVCPLANSLYATVREHEGMLFLYMKTAERAHLPSKLWQKVELAKNFGDALAQVDEHLMYWPKGIVLKVKQRLTRLRQVLLRSRRLELSTKKTLVPIKKKTERREAHREEKAEKAAQVELAIESELLKRLKQGTYGDLYVIPKEKQTEEEMEAELDEIIEEEDQNYYVDEEDEEEYEVGDDDMLANLAVDSDDEEEEEPAPGKGARRKRLEVEYETEEGPKMELASSGKRRR